LKIKRSLNKRRRKRKGKKHLIYNNNWKQKKKMLKPRKIHPKLRRKNARHNLRMNL
jgi:hypothetical protein